MGNYARWCVYQLEITIKLKGANQILLDLKDISSYTIRPPVLFRIHSVYETVNEQMISADIPVWPLCDVSFVERVMAGKAKIDEDEASLNGLFLKDIDMPGFQPRSMIAQSSTPAQNMAQSASKKNLLEKKKSKGEEAFGKKETPAGSNSTSPSTTPNKHKSFRLLKKTDNKNVSSFIEQETKPTVGG